MRRVLLREKTKARLTGPGLVLLAAVCVLILSLCRSPGGDINYYNSDATWHVLMTLQAYEETPVSVHKFLPIISMGEEMDKGITWGATIPDGAGNYYYTSFSAAEFVLPYFFIRLFHLPVAESSLYLFNCLLFFTYAALLGLLTAEVFRDRRHGPWLGALAVVVSTCAPELLHGMGVVYWAQSVMQVTLLIQLYAYYRYAARGSRGAYVLFLSLCLVNPYIEWTGFVANGGYMLCELVRCRKTPLRALGKFALPGVLTAASFALFSLHFMSVVTPADYWAALASRFLVRSALSSASFLTLFKGYVSSFLFLWPLLAALLLAVTACWRGLGWARESLLARQGWLLFAAAFPALENIVMKQHAITYTYDRMKLIFPLTLILCDLCGLIWARAEKKVWLAAIPVVLALAAAGANVCAYVGNNDYIWPAEYREDNRVLAERVSAYEEDSVMGCTAYAGRAIYLDFHRGVYEYVDLDAVVSMARENGKRYALLLSFGDNALTSWGMPAYDKVEVYDAETGTLTELRAEDGRILETVVD